MPKAPSKKKSVEQLAQQDEPGDTQDSKGRAKAATNRPRSRNASKARGGSARHPRVSEVVKRNQQIVLMRLTKNMTWTQIAAAFEITEKTAREGYRTYVEEIAPLVTSEQPDALAGEYILKLEGVQAQFAEMASNAKNESVRMGALRELVNTMWKEIELRQSLGLMPKELGQLKIVAELQWVAEKMVDLLKSFDAPPEAFREFRSIMAGERDN